MFMVGKKKLGCLVLLGSLVSATGAYAVHPELVVPEVAQVHHKACQEIIRLGKKYQVEGLFSKEFMEGKSGCSRIEVASAVVVLTEKMAEKAAREGTDAVDRADLLLLADLREELRAEMLLASTRTFQQRHEELGTKFTALTKNISLSGGLIGVVQGTIGNDSAGDGKDHADVVGRGDLVFNFKIADSTIAVIDVEATGGDGIDAHIPSYSLLNGVAGSTDDTVRFREAWVEHAAFDDRLVVTAGKVDLTNYFDANNVANDENSQFLSGAFVNSPVLGAADIGPGVRVQAKLAEPLTVGLGYGSGDADADDAFEHGFAVAELGYQLKIGELEGNYRIYGTLDSSLPEAEETDQDGNGVLDIVSDKLARRNAFGFGVSIDQQVTDKISLFARYGRRDKDVYTSYAAWSAGGQVTGLIPARKDDVLGFAYGQVVAAADRQEKLAEVYYRFQVNDQIAFAPVAQYLMNPLGQSRVDSIAALALRTEISF